ncbi:hypothetical protein SAMN05421678_10515 [Actinopolymorpha cephalotaxi]|uniref:Tetratricopeptide (TPR) repeat protein n=1 Tax=Actinopolymorpha cephalotaxi TaxID=504797 RepID=A0A1I2QL69_9ACTN|nr:hypothetical protein [Actinopolymorpha cephalotaxi]NYH82578.1 tetratricopeptide (TPR) repeat protein [Actinopolymorpha cephalotaxi]SFG29355.1 hypothetical protein SAMN05421678_10515 [Actinopolymorpha cephalotaxi]
MSTPPVDGNRPPSAPPAAGAAAGTVSGPASGGPSRRPGSAPSGHGYQPGTVRHPERAAPADVTDLGGPEPWVLRRPRSGPLHLLLRSTSAIALALLSGVAVNVLTDVWNTSPLGTDLNGAVRVGLVLVLVGVVLVAVVLRVLERRRAQAAGRATEPALVAPGTPIRPAWHRAEPVLDDREAAVAHGVRVLREHGVAAIVGEPGTGTSAVAAGVVHALLEPGTIRAGQVAPFDLRGWAWEPDSPLTLASHLLPAFGLTAPTSDADLPEAARRLHGVLTERRVLLVLDNLTATSQLEWLAPVLFARPREPRLLVVGRPGLAELFEPLEPVEPLRTRQEDRPDRPGPTCRPEDSAGPAGDGERTEPGSDGDGDRSGGRSYEVVTLAPVGTETLRAVWEAAGGPSVPPGGWLDGVLPRCGGLPKAAHDLAREYTRLGGPWTPDELLRALDGSAGRPGMELVWTVILERTGGSLSRRARLLLGALAELSVTELTVEAIEAVRGSLDDLIDILERGEDLLPGGRPDPAPDPVAELRDRRLVRETAAGRYRLPDEIRTVIRAPGTTAEGAAGAAVARQALVRHYATLARTWMRALDSARGAAAAARWFQTTEPLLNALLAGAPREESPELGAGSTPGAGPWFLGRGLGAGLGAGSGPGPRDGSGAGLVDDLCTLADALDRWRARTGRPGNPAGQPVEFVRVLRQSRRPDLAQLARIRQAATLRQEGRLAEAEAELERAAHTPLPVRHRRYASALQARRHHETALQQLALAAAADDPTAAGVRLRDAEQELNLCWAALPVRDVSGEVTTLLTMAEVHLRQGLPGRALDRLDLAEVRAVDTADPSGLAYTHELRGVAAWMQGRSPAAVVRWQRALTGFRQIADTAGQARCLQHLGSAVLVAPELTGLLLEERRRPHDEVAAARQAQAWLERSRRLRSGPPTAVAEEYLTLARRHARRGGAGSPSGPEELPADAQPSRPGPDAAPATRIGRFLAGFGRRTS